MLLLLQLLLLLLLPLILLMLLLMIQLHLLLLLPLLCSMVKVGLVKSWTEETIAHPSGKHGLAVASCGQLQLQLRHAAAIGAISMRICNRYITHACDFEVISHGTG